ncbi:MAG TPA: hypothetical protein VFQ76_10635, partial [Longimicrobiaceae bacterium]|nr:hypothetical protein [Longimicrobiaceae bacterium]
MVDIYAPPIPPSGNGHPPDPNATRASLSWEDPGAARGPAEPPPAQGSERSVLHDVKVRVHRRLLERLNLANLDTLDREPVVVEIRKVLHELLSREV